jgi:hypothetical protein
LQNRNGFVFQFRGFNDEGIPTKENLEELSLDYVAEDLVRRGILTDSEAASFK